MRSLFVSTFVLLASGFVCLGQPIQALRFEGLWKLTGPTQDVARNPDVVRAYLGGAVSRE